MFIGGRILALSVLAGCVSEKGHRADPLKLDAAVAGGQSNGATLGPLAWGLGPGTAAQSPAPQDPRETPEQRDARLRLQFGSNVLIGTDGQVTKQYFLAGDLGLTFLKLIADITPEQLAFARDKIPLPLPGTKVGGKDSHSILGRMLRDHEVEVTYVPEFEILSGANLVDATGPGVAPAVRGAPLVSPEKAPSVALALVTALPSALAAFEGALDLFYSSIPQIEITVTVVEYQSADALAFGVAKFAPVNPPILTNLSSSQLVRSYTSSFRCGHRPWARRRSPTWAASRSAASTRAGSSTSCSKRSRPTASRTSRARRSSSCATAASRRSRR